MAVGADMTVCTEAPVLGATAPALTTTFEAAACAPGGELLRGVAAVRQGDGACHTRVAIDAATLCGPSLLEPISQQLCTPPGCPDIGSWVVARRTAEAVPRGSWSEELPTKVAGGAGATEDAPTAALPCELGTASLPTQLPLPLDVVSSRLSLCSKQWRSALILDTFWAVCASLLC